MDRTRTEILISGDVIIWASGKTRFSERFLVSNSAIKVSNLSVLCDYDL